MELFRYYARFRHNRREKTTGFQFRVDLRLIEFLDVIKTSIDPSFSIIDQQPLRPLLMM
jgi:hypothetical protein